MNITYRPISPVFSDTTNVMRAAKLYQYAKNATFAPHFHPNFNKTWKKICTNIPIIIW